MTQDPETNPTLDPTEETPEGEVHSLEIGDDATSETNGTPEHEEEEETP